MSTSDLSSIDLRKEIGGDSLTDLDLPNVSQYSEPDSTQIPDQEQNFNETDLCQQLTETLSVSSVLTHSLTPIPSLTDRTISISRNTNSLTGYYEEGTYGTYEVEGNVKLTNWTTRSLYSSTDDMISSGIFDSDIEASGNEIESLEKESTTSNEDSAYKWHDISTSDLPDDEDETYVPYRKPREIVDSSADDEEQRPRRPRGFSVRRRERSDYSYPSSGDRRFFDDSSDLVTEEDERSSFKTSVHSISTATEMVSSGYDDTAAATCSSVFSDLTDSEKILDGTIADDENLEHNMIATRYGLPHEKIRCKCHVDAQKARKGPHLDISVCKSGSCHKFEDKFGKPDKGAIKDRRAIKRSNGYRKACRVYRDFTTKPDPLIRMAFKKADYKLKVTYPYYWVYLMENFKTFIGDSHLEQERALKEEVVETCERIIKEQCFFRQHYQVTMRDPGDHVKFSVDFRHLNDDFKLACDFLMREYPSLFQYLMKKLGFEIFAEMRLRVEVNYKKFISSVKQRHKVLNKLNDKYFRESLEAMKKMKKS